MKPPHALSLSTVAAGLMLATTAVLATSPHEMKLAANTELVRSNGSEVESLDIALIESQPAITVADDLYEGLTTRNTQGEIKPGVAESWSQTGLTTWMFKLRHNAKWSNGDPVTAQDFVYSWQRTVDPKTATQYGIFFEFIKNGKAIMAGKLPVSQLGIKALDSYTLEVITETPTAFLTDMLANPQMAPLHKATLLKYGKEFTKPGKLVSNGAYVLKEWVVNARLVLEKNPYYWDAKNVKITKVTFNPTESEDVALKMYRAGQVDVLDRTPTGMFQQLRRQSPKEMSTNKSLALYYFGLNNEDSVMKDQRVRQALSMVIDRDILTQKVLGEGQVPVYGLIVPGTVGADVTAYEWSKWPMAKRVAEAKALLTAAGYGPANPLSIRISYNTSEGHKKVSLFLSSEWRTKLGVKKVEMENQEFKVFLKTRHDGAYQIARNGWSADYNDATSFLDLVRCGSNQNDLRYCNKKVDALIVKGNENTDPAKRTQLMTQAAKLAMDDYPMIPLYQYAHPRMVKPWVIGWKVPNPMDHYKTQFLSLAPR